jgi:hypothetical protein
MSLWVRPNQLLHLTRPLVCFSWLAGQAIRLVVSPAGLLSLVVRQDEGTGQATGGVSRSG